MLNNFNYMYFQIFVRLVILKTCQLLDKVCNFTVILAKPAIYYIIKIIKIYLLHFNYNKYVYSKIETKGKSIMYCHIK